jgi:glycosyltransferase involved in cell wall biosynthesis
MTTQGAKSGSPLRPSVSVVLPAKNEARALEALLPKIRRTLPDAEILVIDDGSDDDTAQISRRLGATVLHHPYSMGNGAAIKTGARAASGEVLVLLDADGQHDPADIERLLTALGRTYDMVVGSRTSSSHASTGRRWANLLYNWLASYMTGQKVKDLTSGFRVVRAAKFREFLYLLPNGFSYPTTSTMAFFRAGYSLAYTSIEAKRRVGKSHLRPLRDGARFLLIIFKIGTLYSPLKLFFPFSGAFSIIGLCYYLYTYLTAGRFTNMSALMFTTAVLIFLIGLVSEQITQLIYRTDPARPHVREVVAGIADDALGLATPPEQPHLSVINLRDP